MLMFCGDLNAYSVAYRGSDDDNVGSILYNTVKPSSRGACAYCLGSR